MATIWNEASSGFTLPPLKSLLLFTSMALLAQSTTIKALEFQCETPGDSRTIKADIPGQQYLCEVSVTYASDGTREVKWYAQNDTLFCSARAYEMRDKYEDLWNYSCTTLPESASVDMLSPTQRTILDQRLKALISKGQQSTPRFTVLDVKAVASTPLDKEPGKIALQFFTSDGDFTEIINDTAQDWNVISTISDMINQISDDAPVTEALVHAISDKGALEIQTTVENGSDNTCFGTQTLALSDDTSIYLPQTKHLFDCQ